MTSLITALMLATQLSVADAKPSAKHQAKRPNRTHQGARPAARPHVHRATPRPHVRPMRPTPPPRARGAHHVHWHNGYWVRTHRNPAFVWRWNPYVGRWTVVIRF